MRGARVLSMAVRGDQFSRRKVFVAEKRGASVVILVEVVEPLRSGSIRHRQHRGDERAGRHAIRGPLVGDFEEAHHAAHDDRPLAHSNGLVAE